jgi:hypothetical protein
MSKKPNIKKQLLEKNPQAKEVFEKNAKLLGKRGEATKKSAYRLGLPYGPNRLISDDRRGEKEEATDRSPHYGR